MQQFRVKNALFLVFLVIFIVPLHAILIFMQHLISIDNEKNDVDGRFAGLCYRPCW